MPPHVVQLRCPSCAHVFMVTGGAVTSPTVDCPACGATIHRTTGAGGRMPDPRPTRDTLPPPSRVATHPRVKVEGPPPPAFNPRPRAWTRPVPPPPPTAKETPDAHDGADSSKTPAKEGT